MKKGLGKCNYFDGMGYIELTFQPIHRAETYTDHVVLIKIWESRRRKATEESLLLQAIKIIINLNYPNFHPKKITFLEIIRNPNVCGI